MRENHHKNTIFVIALAFLLAAALFCGAAAAHEDHDNIVWKAWPYTDSLPGTEWEEEYIGYYLTDNVTLTNETQKVTETLNLCLNGFSITKSEWASMGSIIQVQSGATLNLYDCKKGGSITNYTTGTNGGGVYVAEGGTFNMYGGSITSNNTAHEGGGVYVAEGGTFSMYGGSITGNTATGNGGGVYVNDGIHVEGSASIMNNISNNVFLPLYGSLDLVGNLTGTMLVTPDYTGSIGTASATASGSKHIINEKDNTYAEIKTEDDLKKLIWSKSAFSGTLITLDWNNGSGKKGKIAAFKNETTSFPLAAPTKTLYTFTGWYLQGGTTPLINPDGTLASNVSSYTDASGKWIYEQTTLTLYAGWEQVATVLTLNGNGGSPPSQNITITRGSSKAEPFTTPAKTDCIFTGWYLQDSTTRLINTDGTLVISEATKDYVDFDGKWIYNQTTLTLDAGWGVNKTSITYHDETTETLVEISWGQTFDVKTPDPKTGDEFFGWVYIDASGASKRFSLYDGTQPVYISNSPYYDKDQKWISDEESLDLYALWASSAVPGPSPSSGDMTVSYQEGGASYTLSIPSDLTLTRDRVTPTSIGVTNVKVPEGQHVDVTLTSNDVASDDKSKFLLKLTGTNAGEVEYNIACTEDDVRKGQNLIGNNDKVIEGVGSGAGKTKPLFFKMTKDPTTAGTYTGTLTFTASVSS